ncbi:MAG: polysaccharide deacetylase family protein [Bacteroidota bacterium]
MLWYQSIPLWFQKISRNLIWQLPTEEKIIYLTFDDGPHPEITPWVIAQLKQYNASATFFCVGDNVIKHPDTYALLAANNHRSGNHTMTHMKGWGTDNSTYFDNVAACSELVKSDLFRPPYGRIKPSQIRHLKHLYKIIMWNLLSCDFDQTLDKEAAIEGLKKNTKKGSIVVFHDSVKAEKNLKYLLPLYLQFLNENGFTCKTL